MSASTSSGWQASCTRDAIQHTPLPDALSTTAAWTALRPPSSSFLPTDFLSPCLPLQDGAGIVEKEELIARVKEVAAAGPEGEAPAGYVFDPATGYYLSPGASCLLARNMRSCASVCVICVLVHAGVKGLPRQVPPLASAVGGSGQQVLARQACRPAACCPRCAAPGKQDWLWWCPRRFSPAVQRRACTGMRPPAASTAAAMASGIAGTRARRSLWSGSSSGRVGSWSQPVDGGPRPLSRRGGSMCA